MEGKKSKFKEVNLISGTTLEEIAIVGIVLLFPNPSHPFDESRRWRELVIEKDNEKIRTIRKFHRVNYLYGAEEGEVMKCGYMFDQFVPEAGHFYKFMLPESISREKLININSEIKTVSEWSEEAKL
jgi:hypothetical protein